MHMCGSIFTKFKLQMNNYRINLQSYNIHVNDVKKMNTKLRRQRGSLKASMVSILKFI